MHRPHRFRDTPKLAAIPWLDHVPASERAVLDRHTTAISVPEGKVLCREGARGLDAFIVVDGEAVVSVKGESVARLTAGSFCGEMALLQRDRRSATVVAVTPMDVLVLSASDFDSLLLHAPSVARRLLLSLASRLREANRRPLSTERTVTSLAAHDVTSDARAADLVADGARDS